jgi:putative sterol carrier protein
MPQFPSKEWCEAIVAAIHADPDSAKAGKGFSASLTASITDVHPFGLYAKSSEGRVTEWRLLEDLDEADEIEADYDVRAGYATWKSLIQNRFDPVEAILQRKVQFRGDLQKVIERAQFKDLVWRVLAKVPTTFR